MKLEPGLKSGGKEDAKKKPHIKKPLNAFMLYMKEMRPKVQYGLESSVKIIDDMYRTCRLFILLLTCCFRKTHLELSYTVLYSVHQSKVNLRPHTQLHPHPDIFLASKLPLNQVVILWRSFSCSLRPVIRNSNGFL